MGAGADPGLNFKGGSSGNFFKRGEGPTTYLGQFIHNGGSGPSGTWLVFTDYIHAVFAHVSSKGA